MILPTTAAPTSACMMYKIQTVHDKNWLRKRFIEIHGWQPGKIDR